jgi:hypothetical protein
MILRMNPAAVSPHRSDRTPRRVIMGFCSARPTGRSLLRFLIVAAIPIALSASLVRSPSAAGLRQVADLLPKHFLPAAHLLPQSNDRAATSRDRSPPISNQVEPGAGWG